MSVTEHLQAATFSLNEHDMDTDAHPEDNLDIDIDLGDSISHVGTDDYMHDDDVQQRLAGANDDDMVDDLDYQEDDADGMMQDDLDQRDEEIFDAGLDEEGDTELVEAVIDSYDVTTHADNGNVDIDIQDDEAEVLEEADVGNLNHNPPAQASPAQAFSYDASTKTQPTDEPQGDIAHAASDNDDKAPLENLDDQDPTEDAQQDDDTFTVDEYYATHDGFPNSRNDGHSTSELEPSAERHDSPAAVSPHGDSLTTVQTAHPDEPPNVATTVNSVTPPVIVIFQDSELYLFSTPDRDPTVCLLEDAALLHSNLQDLLLACRNMLNDHVTEGEMLEMDMADLGLTISEVCACSFPLIDMANSCRSQMTPRSSL
jgi:hypothetical protein